MFTCELCEYETERRSSYNKHLTTKKHRLKCVAINCFDKKNEMTTNDHKMTTNDHKMTTNDHKSQKNEILNIENRFQCNYCSKTFSTKAHMRRHELHYCSNNYSNYKEQLKREKREKKRLYKQIEKLLEDNGTVMNNSNNNSNNVTTNINQTNNQTNNIVINNYGDEDLSHITNSVLDKLIKAPGDMINNLTKMIHFNANKPENMNMYIPSRKQKFIKVFKKNQWMLEKKHERIPDLVDRNYNIIDTYYEDCGGSDKLDKTNNKQYKQYQKLIDEKNDKAIKQEYDACELEILNNSDMVVQKHNLT